MEDLLDMMIVYAAPSELGFTAARLLEVSTRPVAS